MNIVLGPDDRAYDGDACRDGFCVTCFDAAAGAPGNFEAEMLDSERFGRWRVDRYLRHVLHVIPALYWRNAATGLTQAAPPEVPRALPVRYEGKPRLRQVRPRPVNKARLAVGLIVSFFGLLATAGSGALAALIMLLVGLIVVRKPLWQLCMRWWRAHSAKPIDPVNLLSYQITSVVALLIGMLLTALGILSSVVATTIFGGVIMLLGAVACAYIMRRSPMEDDES